MNAASKITIIVSCISQLAYAGAASQLINPSFEAGLASWDHDISALPIGSPAQPIGTSGSTSANLGTFDQPDSFIAQTVSLKPGGGYVVGFNLGANSPIIGAVASVELTIIGSSGKLIASQVFGVNSLIYPPTGSTGFVPCSLGFRVPHGEDAVTVSFRDVTLNGGAAVDPMIDNVSLVRGRKHPDSQSLENGSFESGLSAWAFDLSAFSIGNPAQPIGTDGYSCANLGTFDQPDSFIEQTILLKHGKYELNFDVGVNAPALGSVAMVQASVFSSDGNQLALSDVSATSTVYPPTGAVDFVHGSLSFRIKKDETVTIRFSDATPNGGVAIDAMIDNVILSTGK